MRRLTPAASLSSQLEEIAPDGSRIKPLVSTAQGSLSRCVLERGAVSAAVRHKTVEELWHVVKGSGEIWRSDGISARVDRLAAGVSLHISVSVSFQFRADKLEDLEVIISTLPAWPGSDEAELVPGRWPST